MLLQYNYISRIVLKSILLALLAFTIQNILRPSWSWEIHKPLNYLLALVVVLIQDKIAIEKKHAIITLERKMKDQVTTFLLDRGYKVFKENTKRIIFVRENKGFWFRNDFARLNMGSEQLTLKLKLSYLEEVAELRDRENDKLST